VTTTKRAAFNCQYGASQSIDCYQSNLFDVSVDLKTIEGECKPLGEKIREEEETVAKKERNVPAMADAAKALTSTPQGMVIIAVLMSCEPGRNDLPGPDCPVGSEIGDLNTEVQLMSNRIRDFAGEF